VLSVNHQLIGSNIKGDLRTASSDITSKLNSSATGAILSGSSEKTLVQVDFLLGPPRPDFLCRHAAILLVIEALHVLP
jgi:hypothetical protein